MKSERVKSSSRALYYIMELLHVLSVCKRLNVLRFFAQPGILHVAKSALVIDMLQAVVLDSDIIFICLV